MKLYLQQKIFSFRDRSTLYDQAGNEVYYSERPMRMHFGTQIEIKRMSGETVALLRSKVFSFLPTYYVEVNGQIVATIVKKFTLFRNEYTIDGVGWVVHGNMFDHEYAIFQGERQIASVCKAYFTLGDAYEIDIAPDAPIDIALAVVLAIDAVLDDQRD